MCLCVQDLLVIGTFVCVYNINLLGVFLTVKPFWFIYSQLSSLVMQLWECRLAAVSCSDVEMASHLDSAYMGRRMPRRNEID